MAALFKDKEAVTVIGKDSPHYGKMGVITDHHQPKNCLTRYSVLFPDNTTGTISEVMLERFNGKILKPIVPEVKKPKDTVWIETKDGIFTIHCPGEISTMDAELKQPDNVEMIAFDPRCQE